MCHRLGGPTNMIVTAYFRKDNLPGDMAFVFDNVAVRVCQCGKLFGKIPGGVRWVELENCELH